MQSKQAQLDRIQHNNDNNICNKCGNHITTQELIGALCHDCNFKYFNWVEQFGENYDHEKAFFKFIEQREIFVFR